MLKGVMLKGVMLEGVILEGVMRNKCHAVVGRRLAGHPGNRSKPTT